MKGHKFLTIREQLAAARAQISVKRVMFTGGPTFYDNGTEVLRFPADQPRYVGEPSQDIDDAWNALTRGMCPCR